MMMVCVVLFSHQLMEWQQNYEKSRAEQNNLFIFLPRRSDFAIFDGKITKNLAYPNVKENKL